MAQIGGSKFDGVQKFLRQNYCIKTNLTIMNIMKKFKNGKLLQEIKDRAAIKIKFPLTSLDVLVIKDENPASTD